MKNKIIAYLTLLRLNKPIGFFLLLWPTLMALWIAGQGHPDAKIVLIFTIGVAVMRMAGCVINDLIDQPFDSYVERTNKRPLVLKTVTSKEAFLLFGGLILIAFGLVLQLNGMTRWLAVIALMLAVVYPFMKRYIDAPQVVLGLAFGISIPMAFSALTEAIPIEAWILYLATLSWVVAYDTEYAMVDKQDDLKLGLKSTAILFGNRDRWAVLALQGIFLILLAVLGWRLEFGYYYYVGLFLGLGCVIYQFILLYNRHSKGCFQAFMNNNLLGATLFLALIFQYSSSN